MISILIVLPVILAAVSFLFRKKVVNRIILISYAVCHAVVSVGIPAGLGFSILPAEVLAYFSLDALGTLFLLVLSAVNAGVTVYSLYYLKEKNLDAKYDTLYTVFMLLFLVSMTGGVATSHLGLLWVFIEATTLAGGMLISIEQGKAALEAVWKYIFICSIGVAFSFIGIIVLSIGGKALFSLFFADLYAGAGAINAFFLKLSFAFILVGFGTKMGLAPVHAWLPDAHAEAPPPVSAILSGALLNIALLGILRFLPVMNRAGLAPFSNTLVLIMGILSLVVSAAYILAGKNYKRMLAYSSVENMGIIAIGVGIGGGALFAALLAMVTHSLAKTGLFLTSGNIHHLYQSKNSADVTGLLRRNGITGWLWILGFLAIAGMPPFGSFFGKYFLVQAMASQGYIWLIGPFLLVLVVIAFGMGKTVFAMSWGEPPAAERRGTLPAAALIPSLAFLVLLLALGIVIPDFIRDLIFGAQDLLCLNGAN